MKQGKRDDVTGQEMELNAFEQIAGKRRLASILFHVKHRANKAKSKQKSGAPLHTAEKQ